MPMEEVVNYFTTILAVVFKSNPLNLIIKFAIAIIIYIIIKFRLIHFTITNYFIYLMLF
jgi:hypothetical protein